jgi:hypothetical protein
MGSFITFSETSVPMLIFILFYFCFNNYKATFYLRIFPSNNQCFYTKLFIMTFYHGIKLVIPVVIFLFHFLVLIFSSFLYFFISLARNSKKFLCPFCPFKTPLTYVLYLLYQFFSFFLFQGLNLWL